ncbi:hypothetical protein pEaSNUABM34_00007 [Erwinia phage pEa_SNUABM_34]|nr:hypothetical protein pEaSNUABM34_00007 [Erwinia phage pEa_SNUABM_34]QYW05021.1 hypothetical protein pEaSNUABM21_00007 [Erwinia phage pEa_SNUABM_21]
MYRFQTCPIEGTKELVVYRHPSFSNYGLALKVNRTGEQNAVQCDIVSGNIDGVSRLDAITDHTAPLDVQLWAFTCMHILRESVNIESINLDTLFSNNGGIVYYGTSGE